MASFKNIMSGLAQGAAATQAAAASLSGEASGQDTVYVQPEQPATPSWVVPAAIGVAGLVLVLALKK